MPTVSRVDNLDNDTFIPQYRQHKPKRVNPVAPYLHWHLDATDRLHRPTMLMSKT